MSEAAPRKIVVRATNWIGDALMNTPALAALRRLYPEAQIDVIAKPWVAPLFEHNPNVNDLLLYNPQRGLGRVRSFLEVSRHLRREKYDLGVAFQNAFEAAFIMWAGGVPQRVGYSRDGRGALLSRPVPLTPDLRGSHETKYYLHLVRQLGSVEDEPEEYTLCLTGKEREEARRFLCGEGIDPDGPVVVVNPGATYGSAKRWHPGRFARVADHFVEAYGAQIIIVGTQREYPVALEIKTGMGHAPAILSGKTSLRELAAVLSWCNLLLTNDSGTMHVGSAVGIPIVAIFGSTNPKTTHPWGSPFQIVREEVECSPCLLRECPIDHRCMERINADMVVEQTASFVAQAL